MKKQLKARIVHHEGENREDNYLALEIFTEGEWELYTKYQLIGNENDMVYYGILYAIRDLQVMGYQVEFKLIY